MKLVAQNKGLALKFGVVLGRQKQYTLLHLEPITPFKGLRVSHFVDDRDMLSPEP
jgi:hypothetical protein